MYMKVALHIHVYVYNSCSTCESQSWRPPGQTLRRPVFTVCLLLRQIVVSWTIATVRWLRVATFDLVKGCAPSCAFMVSSDDSLRKYIAFQSCAIVKKPSLISLITWEQTLTLVKVCAPLFAQRKSMKYFVNSELRSKVARSRVAPRASQWRFALVSQCEEI